MANNAHITNLSSNSEDYLKAIWNVEEWTGSPAQPTAIAKKTGMRASTVSGAIQRLANLGLVEHTPYGAVRLTEDGRRYAVNMTRRHRLLETCLVQELGYTWDQVHEEAEALEHACSDFMLERIDYKLGHPERDPHGDPIPHVDGTIPQFTSIALDEAPIDEKLTMERVSDDDSELLIYLESRGITVGTVITVEEPEPFSDSVNIRVNRADRADSHSAGAEKGATKKLLVYGFYES